MAPTETFGKGDSSTSPETYLNSKESILSEDFIKNYKEKKVNWGFDGLGYIVYKRTYARNICSDCNSYNVDVDGELKKFCKNCKSLNVRTEEWPETIRRCINGAQKIGAAYSKKEAERLFDYIFNLKCSFGGRMLWQLGTSTVDRFGLASLLNCFFVSMREPEDFCFVFEHLMLGGGVGFSVKREDIHELPRIKKNVAVTHENTKDADFIVPDSRQGWVELLRKIYNAFYITGKSFTYSTTLIRGSGELIRGFGGTASGPRILVEGMEKIVKIFQNRESKKLRSIDVLDINNIIGSIVVAGNVRRSAEIAIGDPDDYLYLRAKRWDLGNIPNHRAMSNNSIFADDNEHISNEVWNSGYEIDKETKMPKGEPYGFINLPLCQKFGRLGEEIKDNCEGVNPCAEIPLADGEACNLSELFLNNISSKEELKDCAALLYKTQKAVWTLPALYEKTSKVGAKNRRIGLGVTGICQSLDKIEWLDECYANLRKVDSNWSKTRGWPESIKLTTVKPSGTLSLLAGSSSGIHPGIYEYYIRRVRMASSDKLVQLCKESGYKTEFVLNFDGSKKTDTVIVEFPCKFENTLLAKDMTAVKQLELVKKLQTVWADNAVSVTVYYKIEELQEIKNWMKQNYSNSLKTVSFLLHQDHGFAQPPYSEISKDEYYSLTDSLKKLSSKTQISNEILDDIECAGGACPVR